MCAQANIARMKYGSKAEDARSDSRNAKYLLQRVLNKVGWLEISDQQAAMALLSHDPYYCTHKFTFLFIWDARRRYLASRSQDGDSGDESDGENMGSASVNIVGDDMGKLFGVSQYEMYRSRGDSLKPMSLLDYACCVSMSKMKPTEGKRFRLGMKGRANSGRFAVEPSTKIPTKYSQGLVSCPMVPIVAGAPPPAYPGHRPKRSNGAIDNEIGRWKRAAKIFVEYYNLLFLPWNQQNDPRDTTLPSLRGWGHQRN